MSIASKTFEVLTHTPVGGFGVNFHFVRPTRLPSVGGHLAQLIDTLPIGRKHDENEQAQFTMVTRFPEHVITETLSEVPEAPPSFRLSFNIHYQMTKEVAFYFDLTPLLQKAYQEGFVETLERTRRLVQALESVVKE